MDYKKYIFLLEEFQTTNNRLMYLMLKNLIAEIGSQSDIESFKVELRKLYKEFISNKNPYDMTDGKVVDPESLENIQNILIKIIDLLNDNYGNFKMYEK
ncbi:hypothetical protein [Chryseobacterium sp.]|uniref:hypothetical protein n=1 Tax=Chryseobacterium sp. TaxID=1871047 RepID=UPI002FCB446E